VHQRVNVPSPGPAVLTDTFGSTVSVGLGPADTGQTWVVAGGTFTPWSEGGGTATVTPPTAGNTRRALSTTMLITSLTLHGQQTR
jgi:hypothetical protein